MPQNGPKTARFGPFRAVRGHELLPNIEIFIPTVFPASCCGALRSETPIKNGYFWIFLGISGHFNTASTLDGTIWGRFMAIGPYGVSPFLMRSLHTVYPAVDLAEKPRIGV